MPLHAPKVLVVDDDPKVRNALARFVRLLGQEPLVAATAEEGLALSQDEDLSSVITDVAMPGIGGIALLQRLDETHRNARFILVTGAGPIAAESLPRGHATVVLPKPWDPAKLEAALTSSGNDRSSYLPPSSQRKGKFCVLLVEDDATDAALFRAALRIGAPEDFTLTHALSLAEARSMLSEQRFDVAVLDLSLGDSYGVQSIARLQLDAPELGIVVLSGHDDNELALRCVQAGAQDYLVKGRVGGPSIAKALRYANERKATEIRLAHLAFRDQLTGLANRTLFRQRIAESLTRARRTKGACAVFLLDMDFFKAINDALGHDAGDSYLQSMAERLQAAVRETDTVARLGGDEFAVLFDPIDAAESAEVLAQRLLRAIREPLAISGVELSPGASIGGALYPDSGKDCDSLLSAADAAMYAVKDAGRNGFRLHGQELTLRVAHRVAMEARLRRAVAEHQLLLHYQPQYSARRELRGTEALLRWQTPEGAEVTAQDFVPLLEECGLIVELGPWILNTACAQLAQWRRDGFDVPRMAVNLSAKQFGRKTLHEEIRTAASAAGLEPSDIELELTETTILHDEKGVAATLSALHDDGFRIVLDDFGTGFSSLSHLQTFPIDAIKIDKSFIRDCVTDPRRRDLVGGIIQLANRLGLEVIAEGVETQPQLRLLDGEGCDLLQGFYFGKAVSAEALAATLTRSSPSVTPPPLISRAVGVQ